MRTATTLLLLFVLAACNDPRFPAPEEDPPPPPQVQNVAPTLSVLQPAATLPVTRGTPITIEYVDDDPDDVATTSFYADADGDPSTTDDRIVIEENRPDGDGAVQTLNWDTAGAPLGPYAIVAITTDGANAPVTATAPGAIVESVSYAQAAAGNSFDTDRGVIAYADGSCISTGTIRFSSAIFGAGEPNETTLAANGQDVYLAAYEPDGALRWARLLPGTGAEDQVWDIARFPDGSFVLPVAVNGSTTFGAGQANETVITATEAYAVAIAKYDASGGLIWARAIQGFGLVGYHNVATFPDGSVVLAAVYERAITLAPGEPEETTLPAPAGRGVFVARYDAAGTFAWVRSLDGLGTENVFGAAGLSDGSCAISGLFEESVVFGGGEAGETLLTSIDESDAFFARFRADGTLAWARSAGGPDHDGNLKLRAGGGGIVAIGIFYETITFGPGEPGETVLTSAGERDSYIASFDPQDGSLQWARRAAGGPDDVVFVGLGLHADGSIFTSGQYVGDATFGPGDVRETVLPDQGNNAICVAKFSASGELTWASYVGGGSTHTVGVAIAAVPDGSCIVTGRFGGGFVTFGPGESNETRVANASPGNETRTATFVARFNADGKF